MVSKAGGVRCLEDVVGPTQATQALFRKLATAPVTEASASEDCITHRRMCTISFDR